MSFRVNDPFAVKWSICDKLCPSELYVIIFGTQTARFDSY